MLRIHRVREARSTRRKKFGKNTILIALTLLLQTAALQAENTLTLQEAVKRTLSENPALKVFKYRQDALIGQLSTAGLRPEYELGLEAENFAGSGQLNDFNQAEMTVALSSTIELGGKRDARIAAVNGGQDRLEAQMQVEALDLLGEVTRRYIDILAAQERVNLAMIGEQLAKATLREAKRRAKVGVAPEVEAKRAKAAATLAHLTVSSEKQQLDYLKVALVLLWGGTAADFTAVEGDLYRVGEDVDFETLYARVEGNPAIQIFAAEERLREAEVRLAKTQASTDVRWSVGLRQFQATDDTAVVAGFSMPLFSGQRNQGAIHSANAARNEVYFRKEAALLTFRSQLYRAFTNRQQAIHTAKDLRTDIVPTLEEALQETQKAYELGRYSYLDYVTARKELLSARRTEIDAATAALRYGAEIEQMTAEPLPADQNLSFEHEGQLQ